MCPRASSRRSDVGVARSEGWIWGGSRREEPRGAERWSDTGVIDDSMRSMGKWNNSRRERGVGLKDECTAWDRWEERNKDERERDGCAGAV